MSRKRFEMRKTINISVSEQMHAYILKQAGYGTVIAKFNNSAGKTIGFVDFAESSRLVPALAITSRKVSHSD